MGVYGGVSPAELPDTFSFVSIPLGPGGLRDQIPCLATASEEGSLANITATEGPKTGAQRSASANSKAMRSWENRARTPEKRGTRTICARWRRRAFWGTGNNTGSSRSLQDQADRGRSEEH